MATSQDLVNADLNLATLDGVVTSNAESVNDRLGQPKLTLAEIQRRSEAAVAAAGFYPVAGSFEVGGTITERNQVLQRTTAPEAYFSWGGALPKVVPAASTVAGTGGEGVTEWTNRNDATLAPTVNELVSIVDLSPSASLFSDAADINSTALPVALAQNRVGANQDRWVMLFGDSHSWGQGAAGWDSFDPLTNFSRRSAFPYSNGYMYKIAEYIRAKFRIEENTYTLGHPQNRGPIYPNIGYRISPNMVDMQKVRPLELVLGYVKTNGEILTAISDETNVNFFSPFARDDGYSTIEYREKSSTGVFQREMINAYAETPDNFQTLGKSYAINIPVNPDWTGSGVDFTQVRDSRDNIIAEYRNDTGVFYLIAKADIENWPNWFKAGKSIYIQGCDSTYRIAEINANGALKLTKENGTDIGDEIVPYLTENFTVYPACYTNTILLRATTVTPARVTYFHVKHHADGALVAVSWSDSIGNGMQLTPYLDPDVGFIKNSSGFNPAFATGFAQISILGADGVIVDVGAGVSLTPTGVLINTGQRTVGVDEEIIYRIDWGSKMMGDLYAYSEPAAGKYLKTRGLIFDNNKIANFSMGAHTIGGMIGTQVAVGETRDHVADILNYTPVQPSHVITQIPFVNEYLNQTSIVAFKANLLAFTEKFKDHMPDSNNYNAQGVDFMLFTSLRNQAIGFEGAVSAPITYDMYVQAAKEFCAANGHAFVDCEKELFRIVDSGRVDYQRLFTDANHPSDFANEVIYRVLCRDYLDFIV